jgi:branched-chain amino acid transport system substrate-binding protein
MRHRWQARTIKTTASEVKTRIGAAPNIFRRQMDFRAMSYFITAVGPLQGKSVAPKEVGRFLRLANGIAKVLGGLHDGGLVHNDIKPPDILVNEVTGEARLTGLGIPSRLPRERSSTRPARNNRRHVQLHGARMLLKLVVPAVLLTIGWATTAVADDNEVLIGVATSFSGWMAAFDIPPTHAAEIAIQDINAAGGVLGKKLRLVHIDTKTDAAQTARAAQDLVKRGVKMMLTACDFDAGAPAALVAQQAGVLAMSSCGADIKYGNLTIGNNVFTMATDAEGTGRILADWAAKKKGWKTAYALLDTFIEYDKSECRGFVARFKELNGDKSVVLEDTFKNGDVSVAAQISRYSALPEKPEIMVICSVPPGLASAIRQFRSAGINIPVLSATGGDGSAWHSAVPGLTDYYNLNYSADSGVEEPRPDARGFDQKYEKQFGERPGSGQGITGHSVMQGWARAAERAKSFDTAAVRAELEKFIDEPLLAGLTTFTPKLHTNLNRPMLMIEIKDIKPSPLGYYDMRKGDYVKW